MGVDFFFHHSHHVECVPHCVKTYDLGEFLKTSSEKYATWFTSYQVILGIIYQKKERIKFGFHEFRNDFAHPTFLVLV